MKRANPPSDDTNDHLNPPAHSYSATIFFQRGVYGIILGSCILLGKHASFTPCCSS